MRLIASGKLSKQFRKSFEEQSQMIFEANKREANLVSPLVSPSLKKVLGVFNEMCEMTLYDGSQGKDKFGTKIENAKRINLSWSQMMLRCLLVYLCVKKMVLAVIEYRYDFLGIEYNKSKLAYERDVNSLQSPAIPEARQPGSQAGWLPSSLNQSIYLRRIQSQRDHYEQILRSYGAPYMHMTIMSECGIVFLVISVLVNYVSPLVLYKVKGPSNIGLIRLLFDEDYERQNVDQLILGEVERIIRSSKYHLTKSIEQVYDCFYGGGVVPGNSARSIDVRLVVLESHLPSSMISHNNTVKILKRLALSGSLHPANRMPDWVARLSTMFLRIWVLLTANTVFWMIVGPIIAEFFFVRKIPIGIVDLISMFESEIMAAIGLFSLNVWLTLYLYVFVDQLHIVNKLKISIQDCIGTICLNEQKLLNDRCSIRTEEQDDWLPTKTTIWRPVYPGNSPLSTLYELLESGLYDNCHHQQQHHSHQPAETIIDDENRLGILEQSENMDIMKKMNEDLLKQLTNYRIFVRQFRPLKDLFSQMARLIHVTCILVPLFVVAHVPYMTRRYCIIFVSLLWCYLLIYDVSLLAVCAYHARCKHLHKLLFTLSAHVVKLQDICSCRFTIYNPFIVTLMSREIDRPDLAIQRISITPFGSPLNYIHVLRIHFWAGVLTAFALFAYETGTSRVTSKSGESSIFGFSV